MLRVRPLLLSLGGAAALAVMAPPVGAVPLPYIEVQASYTGTHGLQTATGIAAVTAGGIGAVSLTLPALSKTQTGFDGWTGSITGSVNLASGAALNFTESLQTGSSAPKDPLTIAATIVGVPVPPDHLGSFAASDQEDFHHSTGVTYGAYYAISDAAFGQASTIFTDAFTAPPKPSHTGTYGHYGTAATPVAAVPAADLSLSEFITFGTSHSNSDPVVQGTVDFNPVAEPGTLGVVLTGLLGLSGLVAMRRRAG